MALSVNSWTTALRIALLRGSISTPWSRVLIVARNRRLEHGERDLVVKIKPPHCRPDQFAGPLDEAAGLQSGEFFSEARWGDDAGGGSQAEEQPFGCRQPRPEALPILDEVRRGDVVLRPRPVPPTLRRFARALVGMGSTPCSVD